MLSFVVTVILIYFVVSIKPLRFVQILTDAITIGGQGAHVCRQGESCQDWSEALAAAHSSYARTGNCAPSFPCRSLSVAKHGWKVLTKGRPVERGI